MSENTSRKAGPNRQVRALVNDAPILPVDQKDGGMSLLSNHKNRKRAWYRRTSGWAASARWWGRCWSTLIAHREDVICFTVESDRTRAIHRLQILLDLETRWAVLFDDGQRTIALRAVSFHR